MIIAGPCSIESKKQLLRTVLELKNEGVDFIRGGCWKPRTRPGGFEGLGVEGLKLAQEMKYRFDVKFCVEVATPKQLEMALRYGMDAIWIGARSTTSPFVIQEIAQALKGVDILTLVKNPMCPSYELWLGAIERIMSSGVKNIMAIHRGFPVFPKLKYRNEPLWELSTLLKRNLPLLEILCDPSHIAGKNTLVEEIMAEAIETDLFSGFMIETHCSPESALTDKDQQLTPKELSMLLEELGLKKNV